MAAPALRPLAALAAALSALAAAARAAGEGGGGAGFFRRGAGTTVPSGATAPTLTVEYNDVAALKAAFASNPGQIAGVILEPVVGNSGFIAPTPEFLQACRDLTTADGALLCFDEVMTGFRVHKNCAQGLFGVTPDLTTMGKVIGGGLPVGAYGGR